MPKCDFHFSKWSTVIIEEGTFIQINVVSRDSKSPSPRSRNFTVVDVPYYSCRFEQCRDDLHLKLHFVYLKNDFVME